LRKLFILLLVATIVQTARGARGQVAADTSLRKSNLTYYFSFGMGAMIGCEQCKATGTTASFTTSMVHGVRIGRKGSVGAGVAFDAYENWKTLPLFGSASWDLFGKSNKVFVQLNYGYASAWINKADAMAYGYKSSTGGKMINPLLGYRIQSGNVRILFSVGFKFQRVFSSYNYPTYYAYPTYASFAPLPPNTKVIRMDMSRLAVGMGISWK
jgi:hypothetical protein